MFSRSTGLALKACSLVLARSVSPPDSSRSDLSRDRWGLALTEVRARQQVSSFLGGTCVAAVVEFGPASSARRDGGLEGGGAKLILPAWRRRLDPQKSGWADYVFRKERQGGNLCDPKLRKERL